MLSRLYLFPIKNISKGGLFIETKVPFKAGEEILMSFNMQGYDRPLKIKGVVVRIDRLGVGIEY
jgi:Tfp pilus assembly protein PilZ